MSNNRKGIDYLKQQAELTKKININPPKPKVHEFSGKEEKSFDIYREDFAQKDFTKTQTNANHLDFSLNYFPQKHESISDQMEFVNTSGFVKKSDFPEYDPPVASLKKQIESWNKKHDDDEFNGNTNHSQSKRQSEEDHQNATKKPRTSNDSLRQTGFEKPVDNFKKELQAKELNEFDQMESHKNGLAMFPNKTTGNSTPVEHIHQNQIEFQEPTDDQNDKTNELLHVDLENDKLCKSNDIPQSINAHQNHSNKNEFESVLISSKELENKLWNTDRINQEKRYTFGLDPPDFKTQANQNKMANNVNPFPDNQINHENGTDSVHNPTNINEFLEGVQRLQQLHEEIKLKDEIIVKLESDYSSLILRTKENEQSFSKELQENQLKLAQLQLKNEEQELIIFHLETKNKENTKKNENGMQENEEIEKLKQEIENLSGVILNQEKQFKRFEETIKLKSSVDENSLAESIVKLTESVKCTKIEKKIEIENRHELMEKNLTEINKKLDIQNDLISTQMVLRNSDNKKDNIEDQIGNLCQKISQKLSDLNFKIPKYNFEIEFNEPKISVNCSCSKSQPHVRQQLVQPENKTKDEFIIQKVNTLDFNFKNSPKKDIEKCVEELNQKTKKNHFLNQKKFEAKLSNNPNASFNLERNEISEIFLDSRSECDPNDNLGSDFSFIKDMREKRESNFRSPQINVTKTAPKANIFMKKQVNVRHIMNGVPDNLFN